MLGDVKCIRKSYIDPHLKNEHVHATLREKTMNEQIQVAEANLQITSWK